MRVGLLLFILVGLFACVPPSGDDDLSVNIDLENELHQSILKAKDERDVQAILTHLISEDLTERHLAVEACGSVIDKSLISPLMDILNNDPSNDVRALAAYAIGQQNDSSVQGDLVSAYRNQDSTNYNTPVRGAILEALGKCADQSILDFIGAVSSFTNDTDQLLLGQARAIYRYGLRGIYSDAGTTTMINNVLDVSRPAATRLMAAQYLSRNPNLNLDDSINQLINTLNSEQDVDVKMALAGVLTRSGNVNALPSLLPMLTDATDYRVKSNIIRQLGMFDYNLYRDTVLTLLDDGTNDHVFNLAVDLLKEKAPRQEEAYYLDLSRKTASEIKKPKLLSIVLNSLPARFVNTRNARSNEIKAGLDAATQEYVQAEYIKTLALDPVNLPTIIEKGLNASSAVVRTTAINSIPTLLNNDRTTSVFIRPSAMARFRSTIASALTTVLQTGDSGSIAAIASVARDESCGFKEEAGFNLALRSAMRGLNLPQDYEAHKECLTSLGYLEDTTYQIDPPRFNHPVDYTRLTSLNDSSRAYIITTKGQIEMSLYRHAAPGSVSNFIGLAEDNFYDGKTIHRVVPNFVIQGGCPRGDGYGSLDYTIRSELGPSYYDDEGYVGMASAGADTEGTQWFITHSPTPHLDGRYTIFGKVTAGMEVVHTIQPGDIIQDVRILRY